MFEKLIEKFTQKKEVKSVKDRLPSFTPEERHRILVDSAKDRLSSYTPEERRWILADAANAYQKAATEMQEKRDAFYKLNGYWPDI